MLSRLFRLFLKDPRRWVRWSAQCSAQSVSRPSRWQAVRGEVRYGFVLEAAISSRLLLFFLSFNFSRQHVFDCNCTDLDLIVRKVKRQTLTTSCQLNSLTHLLTHSRTIKSQSQSQSYTPPSPNVQPRQNTTNTSKNQQEHLCNGFH